MKAMTHSMQIHMAYSRESIEKKQQFPSGLNKFLAADDAEQENR